MGRFLLMPWKKGSRFLDYPFMSLFYFKLYSFYDPDRNSYLIFAAMVCQDGMSNTINYFLEIQSQKNISGTAERQKTGCLHDRKLP